jgi:hypothetical protein
VSEQGTAQTVRWYADNGTLYWIALERGARGVLRATDDGDHWRTIALPRDAGRPSDITRFRGSLVVLTETGLFQLEGDRATRIATSTRPTGRNARAPFEITNWICAAPLAVFRGSLYAGSQTDGSLYRVDDGPEPVPETLPPR